MKQESPTTTLDDVIQQKPFVDVPKVVTKDNNNVNNSVIKGAVAKVDEKADNYNINNNEINNDNNDNSQNSQPIDKQISDVQPMELTNEVKSVVANSTNGNDQNFIDDNDNNDNKSNDNNSNNNNNDNNNNSNNNNNNKEFDDITNKELLSKLSATLAEYYGGGENCDEIEEPQKKRPRSCTKVSSVISAKEGENTVNDAFPEIKIRDFAFPTDDPRHWGQVIIPPEEEEEEEEDSEYTNRRARALYDFAAESSSELSFHEGDNLLIQYRQYDGWLMANLGEETGLVPENYVRLLDDDEEDEDEYGNWAEEGNDNEQN